MAKYTLGIDFGTLSGRCVLVEVNSGEEVAESVMDYPHGVMDECLPNGEKLPPNYALQYPADYTEVLKTTIADVLKKSNTSAEDVVGLGIDFTACTMMTVDEEGTPLCMKDEYKDNKHSYVKLWKHHGAQDEADLINELAAKRCEKWLKIYGGKISCEWALPKILQILREAPEIYENTYRFTEAADWLSFMLTGEDTHSAVFAGIKWLWNTETGFPSNDFMTALDFRLDGIVGTKISQNVLGMDKLAGYINERGAALTGLKIGTPVSLPVIDAHAAMPALNITEDGDSMLILGTSSALIVNFKNVIDAEGIAGYVKDGVVPGLYSYEAGQAAVGDAFAWFTNNGVPAEYTAEAEKRGMGVHKLLREKASKLRVGESGLLALDWWNGNRCILVNSNLTGMILGMTLSTKPEEIYRALIESTAYGLKVVLTQFEENGGKIKGICAAGGIVQKDEMMMQIYADVLEREIKIAGSTQAGALGSAINAAVAAGVYPDVKTAAERLAKPELKTYKPIRENVETYRKLYGEYKILHDYFGKDNMVMERLHKK